MTLAELQALHDRAFPKGKLHTADFGRVADFYAAAHKYIPVLIILIEELRLMTGYRDISDIKNPVDHFRADEVIATHLKDAPK